MKQYENSIENFIKHCSRNRKLDERSVKAYRSDLALLYAYMEEHQLPFPNSISTERYLDYLRNEKGLRASTVMRKYRVFSYYLEYLRSQGLLDDVPGLMPLTVSAGTGTLMVSAGPGTPVVGARPETPAALSRAEVDAFFMALCREYERLDSDFRRRICIRDTVMMKLLFFHGIEVSELLSLKTGDYNRASGMLTLPQKRGAELCIYLFSSELRKTMGQWLDVHGCFECDPEYSGWLFLSKLGRPLSMEMVINIFEKYRLLAGIKKQATPKTLKAGMGQYAREILIGRCDR